MLLINNLYGEYDANTAEGRGANAAANVVKYFKEAQKVASQKAQKLIKGEITLEEACKNEVIEKLAQAYIPYAEIDEETGEINFEYAMAFATVYVNALDKDNDGAIPAQEFGSLGHVIDRIDPTGYITTGKFLAWLIFEDSVDVYSGVISPQEGGKALVMANNDPLFVSDKLQEIYHKLNLKEKEETFATPEPVRS